MNPTGNALHLDGSDDHVKIPDHSDLRMTENYTLEAWVKLDGFRSLAGIISKYHTSDQPSYNLRLSYDMPFNGLNFDGMTTDSGILVLGKWYHIAAVNNAGTRSLFVNGQAQQLTGTAHANGVYTDDVRIGSDFSGQYLNGTVDEVRIWNRPLSETEIQEQMHRTLEGDENGLVAYYGFNYGSGLELFDLTSNGHDGDLVNMNGDEWTDSEIIITDDIPEAYRNDTTAIWWPQIDAGSGTGLALSAVSLGSGNGVIFGHNASTGSQYDTTLMMSRWNRDWRLVFLGDTEISMTFDISDAQAQDPGGLGGYFLLYSTDDVQFSIVDVTVTAEGEDSLTATLPIAKQAAGIYTIARQIDTDEDGVFDDEDNCPDDSNKIVPGICGCGVADTDSDTDGTADCNDNCPNDSNKIVPGICGCGVTDTDSDTDGTVDCNDNCPNDSNKIEPGVCGCGVVDDLTDTDNDGTADCADDCPDDPDKTESGVCGCGVADTDSDTDGTADCNDNCPDDPDKTEQGTCGCGVVEDLADADNDGTVNCIDDCPNDPEKTEPGVCGCGIVEDLTDTDSDSTPDCIDDCPNDPDKIEPGVCGCGVVEDLTDTDSDGTADCADDCPDDPDKTESGICGCGIADTDSDTDGTVDCNDNCPSDPNKTEPGICGCGIVDDLTDSDTDGTIDCNDGCPSDPDKTEPGLCGCGQPEENTEDSDSDGVADCADLCSNFDDSQDSDGDGIPDGCEHADHALEFDGIDDYVSIPDHADLKMTQDFTLEVWVKFNNLSYWAGIISKHQTSSQGSYYLRLNCSSTYSGLGFEGLSTPDDLLETGKWYHVAAVNDGGTRHLYLNGSEETIFLETSYTNANGTDDLRIGSHLDEYFLDGAVDEVRIWSRPLSQSEVLENMHSVVDPASTGLEAYYRFNQENGTTVPDLTGNGHTGMLTNMVSSGAENDWVISYAPNGQSPFVSPQNRTAVWSTVTSMASAGGLAVSSPGLTLEENFLVLDNDGATGISQSNLSWRYSSRWNRLWFFDVVGDVGLDLTFDFDEVGLGSEPDGEDYCLLYSDYGDTFEAVDGTTTAKSSGTVSFSLDSTDVSTGYYGVGKLADCDCEIASGCYFDGNLNPSNSCETCDSTSSTDSWTVVEDGETCDDGLFCNGADTCSDGTCSVHAGSSCDTHCQSCNEETDSCDNITGDCGDGLFCIGGAGTCSEGVCVALNDPCPGVCKTCNEETDTCDNNTNGCDDGIYCNGVDQCSDGECVHPGNPCDPQCGVCNEETDSCDGFSGDCDNGDPCTDGYCSYGSCLSGNSVCENDGVCSLDGEGNAVCDCAEGYAGTYCTECDDSEGLYFSFLDMCLPRNPCWNPIWENQLCADDELEGACPLTGYCDTTHPSGNQYVCIPDMCVSDGTDSICAPMEDPDPCPQATHNCYCISGSCGCYADAKVDLLYLRAQRTIHGIAVDWQTGSEIECGAFRLLRAECIFGLCPDLDGHRELSATTVPCENKAEGAAYSIIDTSAEADVIYSYYLREYDIGGAVFTYGPIKVSVEEWVAVVERPDLVVERGDRAEPRVGWDFWLGDNPTVLLPEKPDTTNPDDSETNSNDIGIAEDSSTLPKGCSQSTTDGLLWVMLLALIISVRKKIKV